MLVQTNFGGVLSIDGAPVGVELGKYFLKEAVSSKNPPAYAGSSDKADGSIIIVIATDAPLDHRQLRRLAERSMAGTRPNRFVHDERQRRLRDRVLDEEPYNAAEPVRNIQVVGNDAMSPLFQAVIETTEEAILNSLFKATTVVGRDKHSAEALPLEQTISILKKYGKVK